MSYASMEAGDVKEQYHHRPERHSDCAAEPAQLQVV